MMDTDDRKAYETIQQLLPICQQFYPLHRNAGASTTAASELRSAIKCFRAQLRRTRNDSGYTNKYRYALARKIKNALNSMGNLTLKYDYDYSHDDGSIWITVDAKRKRKLFTLTSGCKILHADQYSVVVATRVRLVTVHGTIYQAVVIPQDGCEIKRIAFKCSNSGQDSSVYFTEPDCSLFEARQQMVAKYTEIFMSRAELAFA